ncbi:MAG: amino acid ABC transporter substrate-binding protein [Alphaproteobacteria bacterium]|nr:amino acid ABC transporter substrate-binding protein [Alphaproteobacteria bacterium]
MHSFNRLFAAAALGAVAVCGWLDAAQAGATVEAIKKRGNIRCGVSPSTAGFSIVDSTGVRRGFDVDVCRAVAIAMFGDISKVEFVPTTTQTRFTALQSGEVDILSRLTTWSLTRNSTLGLNFPAVTFYDGTGFIVPKKLGVKSAKELSGATVCLQPSTTTELVVADYFRQNNMKFTAVVIESSEEMRAAYFAGRCDVYANDRSSLASIRTQTATPDDHVILPELISKEPLAVAVRKGDEEWGDIVRWTVYAMIEAEELGVTSQNIDQMLGSNDPNVKRLLGVTPGNGKSLGIDDRFAYNVVKLLGNYAEIYEKNLGPKTPINLERGLNTLWNKGGLLYSPPMR